MNSERIKTLASFVSAEDTVLDVGCDHGYLAIFLKKNNLCKEVYASDISKNALKMAEQNFKKYNVKIKSYVSDGFKDIPEYFDTPIIAGMGTRTILDILSLKKFNKIIISSNNELYLLRKSLNKMGYSIKEEKVILEKNHYYVIMLVIKGKQKLNKKSLLYGISNNKEYFKYLYNKNKDLIKKVPFLKRIKLIKENKMLKGLIEKK